MATQIKFDERNYRKHSKKNKAIIKKSLSELGAGRSILLDNEDSLIAGNGVYEQAQALGIPVRVIETDGSELIAVKRTDLATGDEKRRKLALADNVASDLSEFDVPLLQTDWSIEALGEWGVELPEIEEAEPQEAQEDEFDEEKDPIEKRAQRGDIWQLGAHRLMCGDSTDSNNIAALMAGQTADMVFTDPPYGMFLNTEYDGMFANDENHKVTGKRFTKVIGDNDDFKPELINTIFDNFGTCKEIFIWGADYFSELIPNRKDGTWEIWDKRCSESMDKVAGNTFEMCWSKQKHKKLIARILWSGHHGMNGQDSGKRVHPTQKPIELSATAINHTTKASDIVLDLFGGSGSTLIACEQLGRKCYMMELDEHYCDVIIARWEKFTGQKAIKL